MKIRELQKQIEGSYDLTNIVDCQSVIQMLLDDLKSADLRLKGLAMSVKRGASDLDEKADKILEGVQCKSPGEVVGFIMRMGSEMRKASEMSDVELVDGVMSTVWGELDMDDSGSAQLEEIIERFKKVKGIEDGMAD